MIVLMYKEALLNTNQLDSSLPSFVVSLLQVFDGGGLMGHFGIAKTLAILQERFPAQKRSNLLPRGDGPFKVLERVNDNASKLDLPGEYNVSAAFNVTDLSPFDVGDDLRTNLFQEGGNDVNLKATPNTPTNGPMHIPIGPVTRAKAMRFKDELDPGDQGRRTNTRAPRQKDQHSRARVHTRAPGFLSRAASARPLLV